MFLKAVYQTNEVLGSFWRPHDYMAHVPAAKVTANIATPLESDAATVSLSEQGIQLASKMSASTTQASPINISADNDDRDTVKRYIYNGVDGSVKLMDIAV